MRIRPFDYWAAPSLQEGLDELSRSGPGTMVVAGGTDLVVKLKKKQVQPRRLISLHRLKDLDFVSLKDGMVQIGALTRHADVADSRVLHDRLPIVCEAASMIGSWQARNAGTVGGNICNASPAADSAPPFLALDARVVIASSSGEKTVGVEEFFTGPGSTVLQPDEVVKEFVIPVPVQHSSGCYRKLRRRGAVDLSLVSVAIQAELDPDGRTLARVGIGLGAVGPTPIRARAAETCLTGLSLSEARAQLQQVAQMAVEAASPIDDVRASAAYRRSILGTFVLQCANLVLSDLERVGEH